MNDKLKLTLLAITPLIIGNLVNFIPLTIIISVLFLLYWFWIGFISAKFTESGIQSILIGNSFGIISIIILLVTEIIFKRYLTGFLGLQPQMYFLVSIKIPAIVLPLFIAHLNGTLLFGTSFVLMVLVYYIGYIIGRKKIT